MLIIINVSCQNFYIIEHVNTNIYSVWAVGLLINWKRSYYK